MSDPIGNVSRELPPCAAVIAAGGSGQRMGGPVRKQFLAVAGKSVLRHSLELFLALKEVRWIAVVLPAEEVAGFEGGLEAAERGRVFAVEGGASRQESVWRGLEALETYSPALVAIHDAARPLARPEVIRRTLELAALGEGALACAPMRDTVKQVREGLITATIPREGLWLAQTPQSFPFALILAAHRWARENGFAATDDAALCERLGHPVRVAPSDHGNLKLTEAVDMEYARWRLEGGPPELRIGEGWDIHRLGTGRKLILGGVELEHELGLVGHSDADALLHAVTDALLGAAALGDIGRHFPDTDPAYRGADSGELLRKALELVHREGWRPVNCDATIQAQRPKLAPHMDAIRARLAALLELDPGAVNVKAKTGEGLDAVGREEAIAARAVVLLARVR